MENISGFGTPITTLLPIGPAANIKYLYNHTAPAANMCTHTQKLDRK